MYPGPYRGTLERPILELLDQRALAYPSPLAFWPTFSWDPAEFSEVLREHDDVFEQEAASILFALRRDAGNPEVNDLHFVMAGRVVALFADGPTRLLSVDSRIAAVHSRLCRDFRRHLLLAPGGSEVYVATFTPTVASLRRATVQIAAGPRGTVATSLAPGRVLAVEPRWTGVRRLGDDRLLWWGSSPQTWLRVAMTERPWVSHDPDEEMDRLVDVYRTQMLDQRWRERSEKPVGWLTSKRMSGDTVLVFPANEVLDMLLEKAGLEATATHHAPPGWLPIVIQTETHIGLRWLAVAEAAKDPPEGMPAQVLTWKRVRAVKG